MRTEGTRLEEDLTIKLEWLRVPKVMAVHFQTVWRLDLRCASRN